MTECYIFKRHILQFVVNSAGREGERREVGREGGREGGERVGGREGGRREGGRVGGERVGAGKRIQFFAREWDGGRERRERRESGCA